MRNQIKMFTTRTKLKLKSNLRSSTFYIPQNVYFNDFVMNQGDTDVGFLGFSWNDYIYIIYYLLNTYL